MWKLAIEMSGIVRWGAVASVGAASLMLSGCTGWIQPGSKGYDGSKHVWTSARNLPQNVLLIDTRDDSMLWEMEIPAGQWLVTKLIDGEANGDDPDRPDLLKYRIVAAGTARTTLKKTVDVPAAEFRRWELVLRDPTQLTAVTTIPMIELEEMEIGTPVMESIDLSEEAEGESEEG